MSGAILEKCFTSFVFALLNHNFFAYGMTGNDRMPK